MTAFAEAGTADSVVIVVHGTSSRHAPYMKPDSPQFRELQKQYPKSKVIPFYWSGDLSRTDRRVAGEHLADVIGGFHGKGVHVESVIAHSHGCNVFKEAANSLARTTLGPVVPARVGTFIAIAAPERTEHSADGLADKRVCGRVVQVEGGRDFVKDLGRVSPAAPWHTSKTAVTQLASTMRGLLPGALQRPQSPAWWAHELVLLPAATHKALVHHAATFADLLRQALRQALTKSLGSGESSLANTGQRASETRKTGSPISDPRARRLSA